MGNFITLKGLLRVQNLAGCKINFTQTRH